MNTLIKNWTLALAGVCAIMAATALLDGPSDAELARMTADDVAAAQQAERAVLEKLAKCQATRGPRAEVMLAGINGQDFVCRVKEGV